MPRKSEFTFKRGFKANAERLSIEFREKLNIHPCGALSANKLAEYLNVPIYCFSNFIEDQNDLQKVMGGNSVSYDFSALHFSNKDGESVILHNSKHSTARQESNIMHELAHVICKHSIPEEYKNVPIAVGMRYYCEEQEEEARYLGGCLQISKPGLLWSVKKAMTLEQMADYYTASIDMVRYRLNITGIAKRLFQ